jgi:hypothetical protein
MMGGLGSAWGAEMTPEALLAKNPHLRRSEGSVVHRNTDGTSIVLGVGAGDLGGKGGEVEDEANRRAKLKMVEATRGTNVSVAKTLVKDMKVSEKMGQETSSMEVRMNESSSFVTTGTVSRVQSLSSWKSDDGERLFVAVYQSNDVVYLPSSDKLRGALARGTSFADFLPQEQKSTRSEYPTGEGRRKEILEGVANEIYGGIVGTLSKQSGYILTDDKDRASLVLEVETDSLKVANVGAGKSKELSLVLTGEVRIGNERAGETFFRDRFSGKSKRVRYESPKGFEEAFQEVRRDLLSEVQASVRMVRCRLLSKMKLAKIVLGNKGEWFFGIGVDSSVLAKGDEISIWKQRDGEEAKVAQCRVENVEDVIFLMNASGVEKGDYAFRLENAVKLPVD